MIAKTSVFFFFSSKVIFYGKKLFSIVKAFFKSNGRIIIINLVFVALNAH